MKIVFMGTPDFAVPSLQGLIDSAHSVEAVFTQPDKPKGRGYKLNPPPVKALALTHKIPVYQPKSLKSGEEAEQMLEILKEIAPDVIVVVAYGKILPKSVLDIPKYGCINVHASLLPKYRGAGPIQWSVLNGEKETGVTTMMMAEGLDTGDMLLSISTEIGENETASELHDRLSAMGPEVLLKTLEGIENGSVKPVSQDDSLSCYAPMLAKDLCKIDFNKPAQEVHNKIRGLSDWPCAVATVNGKRLKLFKSELVANCGSNAVPGTIVKSNGFTICCGDGNGVSILELQADGGKRMKISDYLLGNKIEPGSIAE